MFRLYPLFILFLQKVICFDGFLSNEWLLVAQFTLHEAELYAKMHGFDEVLEVFPNTFVLIDRQLPRSSKKHTDRRKSQHTYNDKVRLFEQQEWHNVSLREALVNDPFWPQMWYMNRNDSVSMRITEAWGSGYRGTGVNIAIVDNGIETNHPDLMDKYDGTNSRDVYDNDLDPNPGPGERHGTNCAGMAVASNNSVCIIGSAFGSNLIGIRLIGPLGVTDAGKIQAFSNAATHVSSNSWGGRENTFDGPSASVKSALKYGAENLRGGLGTIYVFSGGNGGFDDNCNMDGYVTSIYTVAINGVTRSFRPPGYAEPCTAILASTFSGPGDSTDNICTTNVGSDCINTFSGTSAAAAMASGIVALALEANPSLSWRDMQEIIIITSKHSGLLNGNFKINAVGRHVSDWFGYGLLDAEAMIKVALNWTCLPEQHTCSGGYVTVNKQIISNDPSRRVESTITTTGCNNTRNCVNRVEHVAAEVTFQTSLRGAVLLFLESPMGTTSQLLTRRNEDKVNNVNHLWTYMSVQHWGENPAGTWKLTMSLEYDFGQSGAYFNSSLRLHARGNLISWSLLLYGTGEGCSPLTSSTSYNTNSTCPSGGSTGSTVSYSVPDPPCFFERTSCYVPIFAAVAVAFVVLLLCIVFGPKRLLCIKNENS